MRTTQTSNIPRIPALELFPVLEGGTLNAKATVGEPFPIRATVFREGHDAYQAEAVLIDPDGNDYCLTKMVSIAPGLDRYEAWMMPNQPGFWSFCVQTWSDPYATWCHDAAIKIENGIDVELTFEEGACLLERVASGKTLGTQQSSSHCEPPEDQKTVLHNAAQIMRDSSRLTQQRLSAGLSSQVLHVIRSFPLRDLVDRTPSYPLYVAHNRALYGSWYEIFPRSAGAYQDSDGTWKSGTFHHAANELERIKDMGFNVVYLTPIHPIGTTYRKGKNNTLNATLQDPGSPYAIGSPDGGHDAIEPQLGTLNDFDTFVHRANALGMDVALDFALQCSPDHPWVKEHPQWFTKRADGSIAYAENPPKKYQDIYPINFDNDPEGLYEAIVDIIEHWIDHGVTIFRVDNPHTKPIPFWKRFMDYMHSRHPDIIFLSEAFTRPAIMRTLGMVGFDQSYTYFTWRTRKEEIEDYLVEVSCETSHMLRPAFWPITHDILTEQMVTGGTTMFAIRAILAGTGSPTWGIYSGYEFVENVQRPGYEEQIDNEKYEYRPRIWDDAQDTGIPQLLTVLNSIRSRHPALRQLHQLSIHETSHPDVICFSRHIDAQFTQDGKPDTVIVVLSLNPHDHVCSFVTLDLKAPGIRDLVPDCNHHLELTDELDGQNYEWSVTSNVIFSPDTRIAHVFSVN